jgi:hypothetical protein
VAFKNHARARATAPNDPAKLGSFRAGVRARDAEGTFGQIWAHSFGFDRAAKADGQVWPMDLASIERMKAHPILLWLDLTRQAAGAAERSPDRRRTRAAKYIRVSAPLRTRLVHIAQTKAELYHAV